MISFFLKKRNSIVTLLFVVVLFAGSVFLGTYNAKACCGEDAPDGGDFLVETATCSIAASETSVPSGTDVTFTLTSENATHARLFLNGDDRGLFDSSNETFTHTITEDRTYRVVAINAGNNSECSVTVSVTEPEPEPVAPSCTISASVSSVTVGDNVTFTLSSSGNTSNARLFLNGDDRGLFDSPNETFTHSITEDRTYRTVVTSPEGLQAECSVSVNTSPAPTVASPPSSPPPTSPPPPSTPTPSGALPTCDAFSVSPTSLPLGGDAVTLEWETTAASSVAIDNGVGSVADDGNVSVNVTNDTTFTLTATNAAGSVTCSDTVTTADAVVATAGGGGGGGGGSSSPFCSRFELVERLPNGDVTVSWRTRRGSDLRIEPNLFETSDNSLIDEGQTTLTPTSNRLELIVERGSRDDNCFLDLDGGSNITLVSSSEPFVLSLSQVPYTGFNAGPLLTFIFYALLVLWSFGVAYVLVVRKGTVFGFRLNFERVGKKAGATPAAGAGTAIPHAEYSMKAGASESEEVHERVSESLSRSTASAPSNLPIADVGDSIFEISDQLPTQTNGSLESYAHSLNVLCSSDALRMIEDQAASFEEQYAALDAVVERAKSSYPREDGWLVLNRERINELYRETNYRQESVPQVTSETSPNHSHDRSTLLAIAILKGDITSAYQALGSNPILSLAGAAGALDALYRTCRGEVCEVNPALQSVAQAFNERQLEAIIAALSCAIDGIYSDEAGAIKVAILKAANAAAQG